MSSDSIDKITAATKEINYVRKANKKLDERFELSKNKRSQADNAISNVRIVQDNFNSAKYTFSITVSAENVDPEVEGEYDDELLEIQKVITAFLADIHTKI